MKHSLTISGFRLIAAIGLALAAPLSMAGGQPNVSWSVNIGSPYPAPQVVAPPVVYVQPQPVYVRPQPVYVQPATVVQYGPTYYVDERPYGRQKHRHWKHGHRQHDHYRHYDY